MAIKDFWRNIQSAAGFLFPRANVVPTGLDRGRIVTTLRVAGIWAAPGAVKGYDPGEFDFLSDEERTTLDEGVRELRGVAGSTTGRAPSSTDQVADQSAAFLKILEVLRPDKYKDLDAFVIGKQIERQVGAELPGWVKGLTFKTDYDSIGEPALRISVLAEDSALADNFLRENTRSVQHLIAEAAFEVCPERFPYFHFWTISENERAIKAVRA